MNWLTFGVAAWVVLGVEWGFRAALKLGTSDIAPYFPIVLVVFIALWAPVGHAMGAAVAMGLLWDFLAHQPTADGTYVVVLGPHALGCALTAYTVVTLRGVMLRKNVLTLSMLAALGAGLAQLVVVVLIAVRSWYDIVLFPSPLAELGGRLGSSLYTGVLAAVLAPALALVRPLFSFGPVGGPGFRAS